jgi:hypothetical protein
MVAVYCVLAVRAAVGVKRAALLAASWVTAPATAAPPTPATATVKVPAVVTVEALIGALKVALIFWMTGTFVAPLTGTVEVTAAADPVLNVQTTLDASAVPDVSFAPVVIVAVYNVDVASGLPGVKVAVFPTYATPPGTAVALGPASVKVVGLIVVASIGALNVALTVALLATPDEPFVGTVELATGGTAAVAVVKVHTKFAASGAPVEALAPVVIVPVYIIPLARTA